MSVSRLLSAAELRASLALPKTAFPMRANASVREPAAVSRLTTELYKRQLGSRGGEPFVLHDGPPYANGPLHIGHALNKILKDIVNRYQLLRGRQVLFVPGWDCHGLPIELKALESLAAAEKKAASGATKTSKSTISAEKALERPDMTPLQVRAAARSWADAAIIEQRKDFVRWGILADWSPDNSGIYTTMMPAYEAAQLGVFRKMFDDGVIFRSVKPVYWSPSSRTALAEAELEYKDDHTSHTAFIGFPICDSPCDNTLSQQLKAWHTSALIWTTTPWTLPANVAISVHPDITYCVARAPATSASFLVALERLPELKRVYALQAQADGSQRTHTSSGEWEILTTCTGAQLRGLSFQHPTHHRASPILCGTHVTNDSGTGLVHTAPGHGVEDFDVCRAHPELNLPVLCPIDDAGRFTEAAGPGLCGLPVLTQGNAAALQMLCASGHVLHTERITHRYPYDWRTKQPVLIRATKQWFANVEKLLGSALSGLDAVKMVPSVSRHRLDAMIGSRKEWCISRQRSWGVPIPVFFDKVTDEPFITHASVAHVMDIVCERGTDAWWQLSVEELLPRSLKAEASRLRKGTDTLDVWFDSGTAWLSTWAGRSKGPGGSAAAPDATTIPPSDVVLEGSDQHRGWFQSSLLTATACMKQAPFKTIVTHGFVLDENQRKMSKSLGNVISPQDVIDGSSNKSGKKLFPTPYGADVLRYWVASTDFSNDVSVGPTVMATVSEALRKIRNTCRFLLASLHGLSDREKTAFQLLCGSASGSMDALQTLWSSSPSQLWSREGLESLTPLDRYMLLRLAEYNKEAAVAYEAFNFSKVVQSANVLASVHLSAQYVDMLKDRLYADALDSPRRLSARAVLFECLRHLCLSVAPIAPFCAEDVYQHSHELISSTSTTDALVSPEYASSTVFDSRWPLVCDAWSDDAVRARWSIVMDVHSKVLALLEVARKENGLGSGLEAAVFVRVPETHAAFGHLSSLRDSGDLSDVFGVSAAVINCEHSGAAAQTPTQLDKSTFRHACAVTIKGGDEPIRIEVTNAPGQKCSRCWKYSDTVAASFGHALCARCVSVLSA